jgi:DNA polymerase I-like protein with 3'-5' exonuclease and polymerase domains
MLTNKNPKTTKWSEMALSDMAYGNVMDSTYTLKLLDLFIPKIQKLGLYDHHLHLLSPLILKLAKLELRGMLVDEDGLEKLAPKLQEKVENSKKKVTSYSEVAAEDNIASNKDLVNIFFLKESGFGLYPPFRTKKTGTPQVDKNALETLENIIEEELEKRNKESSNNLKRKK